MTENPDLRSVRVEVEPESGWTVEAPEVETSANRSKVGIVSGAVGLGLVAFLMVLALRADEPAAEGTTSAVDPSTSVAESVAMSADVEISAELFEQTSGTSQLQSVIRAPGGFLGLSWDQSAQQLPIVVRSVDGVDWSAVDVVLDDSNARARNEGQFERIYEQLIRTEDGYALLMTTVWVQSDGDLSPSAVRIERLTSPDGALWSTDSSFEPVDVADGFPRVVSHGANSFVYLAQPTSPVNIPLKELLDEQVADGADFDGLCWADAQADGGLSLNFCTSGDIVLLDAADTIDPDRFGLLRECAVFLSQNGASDSSFWVAHRGLTTQHLADANSLLVQPSIAHDGTVVAIDFSRPLWLDKSACVEFLDFDDAGPSALVVSDPQSSNGRVRLPVPDEIDVLSLLSVRAEPLITGRAMLLLIGSTVTSIDIDTGKWTEILALRFRVDDEAAVRFTLDGSQLIHLDSARVTAIDARTGDERWREDMGGGNRPGFPWMLYADNDVVFAQGGNSMFKVDLPAS
jgi:hypothetical protein